MTLSGDRTHKFLGEESFEGSYNLNDDPTWVNIFVCGKRPCALNAFAQVVDPIDGTANFVHGLQWTAVSELD
eukprot:766721-Hanusia_phi.AAC.4